MHIYLLRIGMCVLEGEGMGMGGGGSGVARLD